MNLSGIKFLCLSLLILTSGICSAQQALDKAGCKESPLISRFPESIITDCKDMADDTFTFTLDKGKQKVEGEFHMILFNFPSTASKAQVVRNMNTAMRRAGYTMVYDSGDYGDFTGRMGKTWFQIEIGGAGAIRETIVKEITLTQDVVANAAELSASLTTSGHSVVNGILFDTGKAEVKPESAAALQEVVKLLQQDPKLRIYVVGHTDNVGVLAANLELSKRRAAAVVQVLTAQFGVAAARLEPFGAGPCAAIASNETEDGRRSLDGIGEIPILQWLARRPDLMQLIPGQLGFRGRVCLDVGVTKPFLPRHRAGDIDNLAVRQLAGNLRVEPA